jgi:hypothetical protein
MAGTPRLVAPELSWPEGWAVVLGDLSRHLEPLAAEADRGVVTPFDDMIKDFMESPSE